MMTHTEEQFMSELRELGDVKENGDNLMIETIDSAKVIQVFRQHGMAFSIRSSATMKPKKPSKKPRILWSFREITNLGMPFKVRKITKLVCKLGWSYKDPTGQFAESPRVTSIPPDKKRLRLRITAKIGCPALMKITEVYTFPEYNIATEKISNGKSDLNVVQSKMMANLQLAIKDEKEVRKEALYFIVVSKASVHNHPIWELTAPFIPRDGETLRCQRLFDQAKSQNWVLKSGDANASIDSLKDWVSSINSDGEVIRFFKEAGTSNQNDELRVNDFVLIFFNDSQMDALRQFGKKCICIDSHVLNAFNNFLLTSLSVVDDAKHGFPVAFMFSSRVNAALLKIFYQAVRSAFGGIVETNLLVSEMDGAYHSSWASVMTPAKNLVYSSWSVEKAWCENLTLINDNAKQGLTYKNLLSLFGEPDKFEFNVLFEDFCRSLMDDENTREFGVYFIENFGSTANRWAECGRQGMGIDFKLTIERMHNTLQQIILQGRDFKTLRESVQELMHFCMYKTLERVHPKRRIRSLHETHQKSKARLEGYQLDKEGEEWVWKSPKGVVDARIVKFQPGCRCIMKCIKCNGCAHLFICSCYWSSVYLNMCRHIHMLCDTLELPSVYSVLVENRENIIKAESKDSNKEPNFLTGSTASAGLSADDHFVDRQSSENSVVAAVSTILPAFTGPSADDRFAEKRKRIADLMKDIQTRLNDADTEGEFDVVEELLQQVIPVADAHKAEAQSAVKVITLDGVGDIPYYKAPEPVAKRRRVNVQLNRQCGRVVIPKHPRTTAETNVGVEMILGQPLASSEEIVYGEEVVL